MIAVLISNTDGSGKYDPDEHLRFLSAGRMYKLLAGSDAVLFDSATSRDLRDVIKNPDFGNIFVVGHANYHGWRASDKAVDWFDLGLMVDEHLKNGIFVNAGCGGIHSWNRIPLGYFVVLDHNNLFGYTAEYAYSLEDLSRLKPLRKMPSLASLL